MLYNLSIIVGAAILRVKDALFLAKRLQENLPGYPRV